MEDRKKFLYLPKITEGGAEKPDPSRTTWNLSLSLLQVSDLPGTQGGGYRVYLPGVSLGERCV